MTDLGINTLPEKPPQEITINDPVYGIEIIDNPIILELIYSEPMQRLKATEEEQIAGLLHDVSHTTFSHVIDWLLKRHLKEDFQDSQHPKTIEESSIAIILREFGYDPKRIAQYSLFSLLERDLPDLCADRVDYTFRDHLAPPEIRECFKYMKSHEYIDDKDSKVQTIVFTNQDAAVVFSNFYLHKQSTLWGGFESVSRYDIFCKMLTEAMDAGIIVFNDFWTEDQDVINKIIASGNTRLLKVLEILEQNKSLENEKEFPRSKEMFTTKFRRVDPLVLIDGKLIRLSNLNKDFAKLLKQAGKDNLKPIYPATLVI